ncbi:MAG: H-type lectin domain-containing protein [Parabacteroides sp.]|nr:H-type lectin domain-containing protein [Parabacteroides sp.]
MRFKKKRSSNLKVGTTTVLASGQAGAIRTSNIIFDTSFSKMPSISVAIYNEYPSVFQATISKVTKLGFSLYLETIKETSEQSVLVHWIASAK